MSEIIRWWTVKITGNKTDGSIYIVKADGANLALYKAIAAHKHYFDDDPIFSVSANPLPLNTTVVQ